MGDCRRVGVAADFSACSKKALQWVVDNVVRKGDHLILVTIRPETNYEKGEMLLWVTTGSPLIPLNKLSDPLIMKKYGVNPDPETLDLISTASRQKEMLERSYVNQSITFLLTSIMGNRGLGTLQRVNYGKREQLCSEQCFLSCYCCEKHGSKRIPGWH
ncbi:universal stress PHOS32 [Olea europaea subsp. europaea]|uniref:Universal stress PHOS32 n=1 Tax=Olea europaea subsp. europaea TaxID=158383 RepID=A0A8S0TNB8_OLEEU|nr:universal stress PHOS32 [Olea europaea subsp. europaea]